VGKGSEALDNIRPIGLRYNVRMESTSRLPRKGERVALPGVANTFTIFAVRKQSRVVDLRLFACQLLGRERTLLRATAIAYEIKRELRTVGITLRCSVGLAPNRLLAKMSRCA
jgi:nucleotidyltransferase/DNA polymerase involved in DNA repair